MKISKERLRDYRPQDYDRREQKIAHLENQEGEQIDTFERTFKRWRPTHRTGAIGAAGLALSFATFAITKNPWALAPAALCGGLCLWSMHGERRIENQAFTAALRAIDLESQAGKSKEDFSRIQAADAKTLASLAKSMPDDDVDASLEFVDDGLLVGGITVERN